MEACLSEGRSHVIIAATERIHPGVRSVVLARVKPQLLVARKTAINSPGYFWQQTRIAQRLIYPVDSGVLHHTFERGLRALGVNWRPGLRVESTAMMMKMVASGQGVGLGLELPAARQHPDIYAIPLKGFEEVPLSVCWKIPAKPSVTAVVVTIREIARLLWAENKTTLSVDSNVV